MASGVGKVVPRWLICAWGWAKPPQDGSNGTEDGSSGSRDRLGHPKVTQVALGMGQVALATG